MKHPTRSSALLFAMPALLILCCVWLHYAFSERLHSQRTATERLQRELSSLEAKYAKLETIPAVADQFSPPGWQEVSDRIDDLEADLLNLNSYVEEGFAGYDSELPEESSVPASGIVPAPDATPAPVADTGGNDREQVLDAGGGEPDVMCATSKAAFDAMTKSATRGDSYGLAEQAMAGEVLLVPRGTRALYLEGGWTFDVLRITTGDYAGTKIWTYSEFTRDP